MSAEPIVRRLLSLPEPTSLTSLCILDFKIGGFCTDVSFPRRSAVCRRGHHADALRAPTVCVGVSIGGGLCGGRRAGPAPRGRGVSEGGRAQNVTLNGRSRGGCPHAADARGCARSSFARSTAGTCAARSSIRRAELICHTRNTQPHPLSRSYVLPRLSSMKTSRFVGAHSRSLIASVSLFSRRGADRRASGRVFTGCAGAFDLMGDLSIRGDYKSRRRRRSVRIMTPRVERKRSRPSEGE